MPSHKGFLLSDVLRAYGCGKGGVSCGFFYKFDDILSEADSCVHSDSPSELRKLCAVYPARSEVN